MLRDISLGQFVPGDSFLHKLDPRAKIVLTMTFIVMIFFCNNYSSSIFTLLISLFISLFSGISLKLYVKSMKMILFVVCITAFLNLFYGTGEPVFEFGILKITSDGIANSVFVVARLVSLILMSSALTFTTTPNDLTDAIEYLMKPLKFFKVDVHAIAMMMTIAMRFVPTLLEETDKIIMAQKSRGADFETGRLLDRVKALVPVFVPLFVSSFRRAMDLAVAMECRCYQGGENRTRMKVLKFSSYDLIGTAFILMFCIGVIVCNVVVKV